MTNSLYFSAESQKLLKRIKNIIYRLIVVVVSNKFNLEAVQRNYKCYKILPTEPPKFILQRAIFFLTYLLS